MNQTILQKHSSQILAGAKSLGMDDEQLMEVTAMPLRDLVAMQKRRGVLTVPQARAIEAYIQQSISRLAVIGIGTKSPLLEETLELMDVFDSIRDDLPARKRKSVAASKSDANSIAFRKTRATARAK